MNAIVCHAFSYKNGQYNPVAEIQGKGKRFIRIMTTKLLPGGTKVKVHQREDFRWELVN